MSDSPQESGPSTLLHRTAPPQPPARTVPPDEGVPLSVTLCVCPLSTPRGREHVLGPVPGGLHRSLLAAGKCFWVPGGSQGRNRGQRRLGLGEKEGKRSGGPLAHTGLCSQACGPTMHRACGENMYAKGACLLLGCHLQITWTVPATLRSPRDSSSTWSTCWHCSCVQSMKPGSRPLGPPVCRSLPRGLSKHRRGWEHGLAWQEG